MIHKFITPLVFCFAMLSGTTTFATGSNDRIVQHLDVAFSSDHTKQKLDVFRSADNPKAPLVILIHGGGMVQGREGVDIPGCHCIGTEWLCSCQSGIQACDGLP